jgi:D-tyrosyl-tRNA(Tyr) deacylase
MRAVLQRVTSASVRVDGEVVGAIGPGLLAYVGVAEGDGATEAEWLAKRIAELRLFPKSTAESARSMERALLESGRAALVISQFTLLADTKKGRRPSFFAAAAPDLAAPLVDAVVAALRTQGVEVATGRFGAHMEVESVNDGPVTISLDSEAR